MRCLACETENEIAAVNCTVCGLVMVGTRLGQFLFEAEDLIGQARYRQASGQLNLAEAELSMAALDERVLKLALARILAGWGRLHFNQGEYDTALDDVQRAISLAPEADASWWTYTHAYNVLAGIAQYREQLDDAARYIKQALAYAEKGGDHYILAMILNNKADQELDRGEPGMALDTYKVALRHLELADKPTLLSLVNCNMAELYFEMGQMQLALAHAARARELAAAHGHRIRHSNSLTQLGRVHAHLGELPAARKWLMQALDEARASGSVEPLAEVNSALAELSLLAADYASAQRYVRQMLNARSGDRRYEIPALAIMVHSAVWQGDLNSAEHNLRKLQELAAQRGRMQINSAPYLVLTAGPLLQLAKGELQAGSANFAAAIEQLDAGSHNYTPAQARLIYARAVLWFGVKEYQLARRILLEAETCFGRIEAQGYQEQVAALLAALPTE